MTEPTTSSRAGRWAPHLLSALRSVAAFLFIQPRPAKLFAFPAAGPGAGSLDARIRRRAGG